MKSRIREIRKEQGLTQEAFGERIGIQQNSVARIESGNRMPSEPVADMPDELLDKMVEYLEGKRG